MMRAGALGHGVLGLLCVVRRLFGVRRSLGQCPGTCALSDIGLDKDARLDGNKGRSLMGQRTAGCVLPASCFCCHVR